MLDIKHDSLPTVAGGCLVKMFFLSGLGTEKEVIGSHELYTKIISVVLFATSLFVFPNIFSLGIKKLQTIN